MEGYTNVIGNQYDFDDLDIEGRVVDEWNVEDEEKKSALIKGSKYVNEASILSERVKLDNGQQADVFSVVKKKGQVWYTCHVCSDTMVGLSCLRQHVENQKHRTNMNKPIHPRAKFIKLDPKENLALEPGEPVPPGLEEVIIKHCLIQPRLDAYKSPLIGLEYLIELTQSALDEGIYYYCLLCDKTGSERNIFIHFTSIFHYMKYLSIYFPTVARKLHALPNKKLKKSFGLVVTEIVGDIEAKYGRMKPTTETHSNFYSGGRKKELHTAIFEGPHIKESPDDLFDEKATAENVDKKTKELQNAPPFTLKVEENENVDDSKETSGSMFNKVSRINVDKKQLRSRDDNIHSSSPDIQIVDIQLPKSPEKKKRSRSKSLSSISTISSTSSHSRRRPRYDSRYRHQSRLSNHSRSHRNWSRSRSRSRSPGYRYRRRRSPSYSRGRSPGRRSRDRSPRRWNHKRDNRGHSPDSYRYKGIDRYGRTRDKYDSRSDKYNRREKTVSDKDSPKEHYDAEERIRWAKFREDLKQIETVKLEKLKYHEKNPEKHPQYPEEWKAFWNRRYNELQRSGVDPSKHDFKPEWISFWTKRMKELYEEDLGRAKDELKNKFDLPEDPTNTPQFEKGTPWKNPRRRNNTSPGLVDVSPPTPDKKDIIADIKTTWKALTGSDIKETPKRPLSPWEEDSRTRELSPSLRRELRKHSPKSRSQSPLTANEKLLENMPQRKTRTSSLIFVLRKLTVLEHELGSSLCPKVFEMLSQALALEKVKEDASLDLLFEEENCVFLETVREKLIALLCAGVVPRNMVNTSRSAIKHIDIALYLASKRLRSLPVGAPRTAVGGMLSTQNMVANQYSMPTPVPLKSEPVVVPGIGQVDKAAIAQQIATALIEQGKTNVTEAELEQLINAVVGMAEASLNSAQPMTTAYFLHQLQSMQNSSVPNNPTVPVLRRETSAPIFTPTPSFAGGSNTVENSVPKAQSNAAFGALKLLQSAYNDTTKPDQDSPKPEVELADSKSSVITDTELAAVLSTFNKISKEEKSSFIQRIQSTNPDMYKRLSPFIPSNIPAVAKRSPISIPISKERSEQKMKPVVSGRLSPFSSRSGGTNPTVGEGILVHAEEDSNNDENIVTQTSSNPESLQEMPKSKFSNSDGGEEEEDDDDDDDYSFEDVYKAAQEKLRLRQLDEDKSIKQQEAQKEVNTDKSIESDKVTEPKSLHRTGENVMPVTTWGLSSQEQSKMPLSEHFQQQQTQVRPDNNSSQFNEMPSQITQSISYPISGPTSNYEETMQRKQITPYTDSNQQLFQERSVQNYQNINQYSNESSYPEPSDKYYDKTGQYSRELPPYTSTKDSYPQKDPYSTTSINESYNQPQRNPYQPHMNPKDSYAQSQCDPYSSTYRDFNSPYNTQTNAVYGNSARQYDDQYRYRQSYDNSYPPLGTPLRTSGAVNPNSTLRYPSQNYPY